MSTFPISSSDGHRTSIVRGFKYCDGLRSPVVSMIFETRSHGQCNTYVGGFYCYNALWNDNDKSCLQTTNEENNKVISRFLSLDSPPVAPTYTT